MTVDGVTNDRYKHWKILTQIGAAVGIEVVVGRDTITVEVDSLATV